MKKNKLHIYIDKPQEEVFYYSLSSENVPKWLTFIKQEIPSETPVKVGTRLRNISVGSNTWNEYEIIALDAPTTFTLKRINGDYYVRYTCKPESTGTIFEYYEWAEGELDDMIDISALQQLKKLIEEA